MSDAPPPETLAPTELLTVGYEYFNQRDTVELRRLLVDDFQWHEAEQVPGRKSCRSAAEFIAYAAGFDDLWEEFRFVPLEMRPVEGGAVIVKIRGEGRGKASGEPFQLVIHHVWRFRDGRVARMDAFLKRSDAEAAATPD